MNKSILVIEDSLDMQVLFKVQADEKLKTIPVFFLTGKDDISTKVAAFAMGAEDYIVKPFNALELRARVEAKIKRAASQVESQQILRKGDLQLDGATHRVYSLASGEPSRRHLGRLSRSL